MPDPGKLIERVSFEKRRVEVDDLGNQVTGDFAGQFIRPAQYQMRSGSEVVLAARLTGRQPVVIVVRRDSQTLAIDASWRAVDVNTGTVWAITAPPADMDGSRQWLTITAESGIAA